jgi:hypothetical protein
MNLRMSQLKSNDMQPKNNQITIKTDYLIAGVAVILGALMTAYLYSLGLIKALTDADAHLNFGRMMFDSMTPGISQIGFWPPLLHILLAPFTQIEFLYDTGLAGAIVLIPFFALGAVFTYRLAYHFTGNFWLAFAATTLYLTNPYILYYSAVPMMEVMFIANLLGCAYFLARWLNSQRLSHLLWSGIFITFASLSRFEGLILIPIVALIVIAQMIRKRKDYHQTEALMILFGLLAVIGAGVIVVYSWVFGGSPTTFTGGSWIKESVFNFATQGNAINTLRYVLEVCFYMLSQPVILLSLASLLLMFLVADKRFESAAVLFVLASPAVFVAIALFSGSYQAAVPSLPPHNIYLNERYGLTSIGFAILAPIMLAGYLMQRSVFSRALRFASAAAAVILVGSLFAFSFNHLKVVAFSEEFLVIRNNINAPRMQQRLTAEYLNENYDYGKVLITRADNDPLLANAGIDLNDYVYEGNYLYFDQALKEPWIFARWVVMSNPEGADRWAAQNEQVLRAWGGSEEFLVYYDLVHENSKRLVYKINEKAVAEMAARESLNLSAIPSVNEGIEWWDPSEIYAKIQSEATALAPESAKKN